MQISIAAETRWTRLWLNKLQREQLPFATAMALNDLAFQVLDAETDMISHVFPKSGRWTRTAFQVQSKATKGRPIAVVSMRPGRSYLLPYEDGGLHKLLPSKVGGTLLNPKNIQLNAAGQLKAGQLSSLIARPDVFVGEVHGVRGLWQRLPRGRKLGPNAMRLGLQQQQVRLLIRFGNALPVKKRIHFYAVAKSTVSGNAKQALTTALNRAVRSAR